MDKELKCNITNENKSEVFKRTKHFSVDDNVKRKESKLPLMPVVPNKKKGGK